MAISLELNSIFIPLLLKFPARKFKADCQPTWQTVVSSTYGSVNRSVKLSRYSGTMLYCTL